MGESIQQIITDILKGERNKYSYIVTRCEKPIFELVWAYEEREKDYTYIYHLRNSSKGAAAHEELIRIAEDLIPQTE